MFEIFVLAAVIGAAWLAFAVIACIFKLVFGLIGGIFSVIGGLIALFVGGVVMLALLPFLALAMLPVLLPLLLLGGLVWLVVHASRRHPPAPAPTTR